MEALVIRGKMELNVNFYELEGAIFILETSRKTVPVMYIMLRNLRIEPNNDKQGKAKIMIFVQMQNQL